MNQGTTFTLAQLTLAVGMIFCAGCGGDPLPDILPASGVVSIGGKPLPNAEVRFVPMAEGLNGNFVASGITDNKGEFSLRLQGKEEIGCCGCLCKVTIADQPMPDKVRAAYGSGNQGVIKRYDDSLKNRPIPTDYKLLRTTPLKFEVSAEESEFKIEIER